MSTGDKIALVGALGIGAFLVYKLRAVSGASAASSAGAGHAGAAGTNQFTDDQITKKYDGTFNALANLPGVKQALGVVAPVYNGLAKPIADGINNSSAVKRFNSAIGNQVTTTVHDDGTVDRHIKKPNWYERNVGEPISQGATNVGKSIYHAVKFW